MSLLNYFKKLPKRELQGSADDEQCRENVSEKVPRKEDEREERSLISRDQIETPSTSREETHSTINKPVDGLFTSHYDICSSELDNAWKINVIDTLWSPPLGFVWPTSIHKKQGKQEARKLGDIHIKTYKWLCYSASKNGFFCKFCVLFGPSEVGSSKCRQQAGRLVRTPLQTFNKLTGKDGILTCHDTSSYHKASVGAAQDFKLTIANPSNDIRNRVVIQRNEQMQKNRHALMSIIKAIIIFGQQNLPLRGHRDSGAIDERLASNEGNLRAILRLMIDSGDQGLKCHMEKAPRNALYTSPYIQNEIIAVIGDLIQTRIISCTTNGSGLYSVLADETQDISVTEQLCVCLRYVSEGNICERFLCFKDIYHETFELDFSSLEEGEVLEPKLSGRLIGQTILSTISECGLSVESCVGQGYDGASSMSSTVRGAASVILAENPRALYTHCASHSLNLALVSSSEIQEVRNMYGAVRQTVNFINASAKRKTLFEAAVKYKIPGKGTGYLKTVCETRWVEKHEALNTFIELLGPVLLSLDQISKWSNDPSSSTARALSLTVRSTSFIITLFSTACITSRIRPLAVKLQAQNQDMLGAVDMIEALTQTLSNLRSDGAVTTFKLVLNDASQWCDITNVPRRCSRQVHRSNLSTDDDSESYYRVSIFLPILDDVLQNLARRFTDHNKQALRLGFLIPAVIRSGNEQAWLNDAVTFWKPILPNTSLMQAAGEWEVWYNLWDSRDIKERPTDAMSSLDSCDSGSFPTIHKLLQIFACQPVTTATPERSFSNLRRLKTWLRSTTMKEEILNMFALKKARRLNLLI